MKKILSLILGLVLLLSAACAFAADDNVTANGEFPVVKEPITIKIFTQSIPTVVDLNTNHFTQWYEEKTGVHVEWVTAPQGEAENVLNLMLAGGDLPDAIMGLGMRTTTEELYGPGEQMLLPLDDLIDEYAPNFKRIMEESPAIREAITATDGQIYSLPSIQACYHCMYSQKMWINQEWLDALGLEMPTTTDEFYDVLVAFRDGDPNGNGLKDEIPLVGCKETDGWYQSVTGFILNAFTYDPGVYVQVKDYVTGDGQVVTQINQEGYREGLRYLNKLYTEGLIYVDSLTMNSEQVKTLALAEEELVGAAPAGHPAMFLDIATNPERYAHYRPVAPLKGPEGTQYVTYLPFYPVKSGDFYITVDNPYPEATMRWVDEMFNYDVAMWRNWGKEGEAWRVAEEGEVGLDGETPAMYKTLIPFDEQAQNEHWSWILRFRDDKLWNGMNVTEPDMDLYSADGFEKMLLLTTEEMYAPYTTDEANELPPLRMSAEDADEVGLLRVQLKNYIDECRALFIVGDMSLDTDWDTYLQTLEDLGLSDYLALQQAAYDNMFGQQ